MRQSKASWIHMWTAVAVTWMHVGLAFHGTFSHFNTVMAVLWSALAGSHLVIWKVARQDELR